MHIATFFSDTQLETQAPQVSSLLKHVDLLLVMEAEGEDEGPLPLKFRAQARSPEIVLETQFQVGFKKDDVMVHHNLFDSCCCSSCFQTCPSWGKMPKLKCRKI